ncbi:MAG: hypothetical protein H7235_08230 [Bdellovibrionaceae bacterium]|nr:hypothetical protein [Pseudobdellovibrionaceae bacterium]
MFIFIHKFLVFVSLALAINTNELSFDKKAYVMKPLEISKKIESSEVTRDGLKAVWMRMESVDLFDAKKECATSGEVIQLKLKQKNVPACLSKENLIGFTTQAFQKIPYYNIQHFQFKSGVSKEKIVQFFSEVTYQQKVN